MDAKRICFGSMATLTIKNLPDEIYAVLASRAKLHRRSINNEAIVTLERSFDLIPIEENKALERIARLREELASKGVWVTEDLINAAKKEGRP